MQRLNKTAEQTARILKAFTKENKEWGVSALAKHLGYAKSSVHGIVQALVKEGILEKKTDTGLYSCGIQIIRLGLLVLSEIEVRKIARPYLEDIAKITGETVFLCMCIDNKIKIVDAIESSNSLKVSLDIGSELPKDRGAAAKVWYAYLPEEERKSIEENKLFDTSIIGEALTFYLERGFVFSEEEAYENINGIAAPILNRDGKMEAIVAVGGLSSRFNREKMFEAGDILKSKCSEISERLGYKV